MRSQTEKCLTALHPTPSLSLAPGCFPFQRKLRSLAILAGQDARPATPPIPLPQRSSSQDQLSKQNREKKKSLTISKTKKVSRRMAKLLKGQKSVVLPHYQQSSSFLLTPNHFSFFPPFLFFSFPPPFFSRDSFIRLLILAYQVLKARTEDHTIHLIRTENRRPSKLCQLIPHVTHKLRFIF